MADQGGVEFIMELTAQLDDAVKMVKSMTQVAAEAARVEAQLQKAGKASQKMNVMMRLSTAVVGKVGAAFKNAGSSALEAFKGHLSALAAFEGFKAIAGGLINISGEALRAAGEAERTRRSFELLLGDAPANELLGYLDAIAAKTEFTDGALKGFAGQLLRAGYSGEPLKRALAATIDLAAMAQDKMAGAAEAIGLLSKIQLKGGVSERELVSAKIDPAKYFQRVADETGIAMADIEKKIAEGKVKASVLTEALYSELTAKTGKDLGGAGVATSMTYLSQLEKAKDIIPNLFEEIEASGDLMGVTQSLNRLVTGLDPNGPAGGKIIKGLVGMLNHFTALVDSVDFDKLADRLARAMEMFMWVVDLGFRIGGEIGMLFDKFTLFGESLGESLYETVQFAGRFFNAALDIGKSIWEGIRDGIAGGVRYVVDAVSNLGDAVTNKFKSVLGIRSPSVVFENDAMMTGLGFERGVHRSAPIVERAMADVYAPSRLLPALPPPEIPVALAPPAISGAGDRASGAGRTENNFHVDVTVNVGGATGDEDGKREVAETTAVSVRRALIAALEDFGAKGFAT